MDPREQRRARRQAIDQLSAEREARGRNRRGLTRWRRFRRWLGGALVDGCAPFLLRLLARTWRIERSGEAGERMLRSSAPWIVAMWHGRMLTLMPIEGHCGRDIGVLVSPSDDGELARRALERFRYRIVRGSLSRRGARAMREMHALLAAGGQLVITPDGPRGPRHTINSGPAWLARATGAAILPVGVAVSRAWRLSSWDRMTIPKPFARVLVHYGDPIAIADDVDDAELEQISAALRERLLADERRAFARLGVACDHGEASGGQAPDERDPSTRERAPGS